MAEVYEGLIFTLLTDGTYSVAWDNTTIENWNCEIPAIYDGKDVSQIGDNAFKDCGGLKSITIPVSITSIGTDAFTNCSSLATLYYKGTYDHPVSRDTWTDIDGDGKSSITARKYLVNKERVSLPEGAELIRSTTNKDVVSAYAIKDVRGNQIDTYYMPASEKQTLEEIAKGKSASYMVERKSAIKGGEEQTDGSIVGATSIIGVTISKLRIGDVIFIKEANYPDYWVYAVATDTSGVVTAVNLAILETTKVEASIIKSVGAHSLESTEEPSAVITGKVSEQHIEFGIPKGEKGEAPTYSGTAKIDLGGIKKGDVFNDKSLLDVINSLIAPYIASEFTSIGYGGSSEYGTSQTISSITPIFTKNDDAGKDFTLTATAGSTTLFTSQPAVSGTAIACPTPYTWDGTNNLTVTGTLYVDGVSKGSKSYSLSVIKYIYYTTSTSTTTPTTDLTKTSERYTNSYFTVSASSSYIYVYSPTAATKIWQDAGIIGIMDTTVVGIKTITLDSGATCSYTVLRTTNKQTGTLKICVQ